MKKILSTAAVLSAMLSSTAFADECHPDMDKNSQNFIIGYGSLINDQSRERTNPEANDVYPVEVSNFKRVLGHIKNTTFKMSPLFVTPSKGSHLNAVYYPTSKKAISATDKRELTYCRYKVDTSDIKPLGLKNIEKGVYWIYAISPDQITEPTKDIPIVQSYIDLFIVGCMQVQNRYLVKNYVQECLDTTANWNNNAWINDRNNARRPMATQPYAFDVDNILIKYLGDDYRNHPIE